MNIAIIAHDAKKELIQRTLKECGGNKTLAAKKLGISRPTLHRRLKLMDGEESEQNTYSQ